jgi:hypothetical protein
MGNNILEPEISTTIFASFDYSTNIMFNKIIRFFDFDYPAICWGIPPERKTKSGPDCLSQGAPMPLVAILSGIIDMAHFEKSLQ